MEMVVTLLVVGTMLLLAETVLPGAVAGILGLLCLLAGVIAGYYEFGARTGNLLLIAVSFGLIAGLAAWVKIFPTTRFGRAFISQNAVGELNVDKPELLHQSGVAFTQLRPSGTALIGGKRVDVVTEGSLIDKDTPIKVVAIEGMRVVVRQISETTTPSPHSPST